MKPSPLVIEHRAQHRARKIIAPPEAPIITDNRDIWRRRIAWHRATNQRYPVSIWRAS
ncbi:hypothetical protein M8009_12910 [Halomonas sp. ATCH28]|uniref:Uncharacterized protein n=1 Tax=Halomonas gemina TaxID=2945105 RepID=A0ABT0T2M8_9GAMM|nr:hypothetical protein [Halomonas gemina]MCL7941186.1 hypothetical protein [Halomonas gemina]